MNQNTTSFEAIEQPEPPRRSAKFGTRSLFVQMTLVFGAAGTARGLALLPDWPAGAVASSAAVMSVALTLVLVRLSDRRLSFAVMVAVLAGALGLLIIAFVASGEAVIVFATSLPFAFALTRSRRRWFPLCVLVVAISGAVILSGGDGSPIRAGFAMLTLAGAVCVGFIAVLVGQQFQQRKEQYDADQHMLEITRERLRFATDLHDVQGHTLTVIKLKAELARRSLGHDLARARSELAEIEAFAGEANQRTRELAHGYRALNLTAELANAEQLLAAAGMSVSIEREATPEPAWDDLFAAIAREATTNILRHTDARTVRIVLSDATLSIENDGLRGELKIEESDLTGSGLEGLRRRFTDRGGSFTWHSQGDRFIVTGRVQEEA